MNPIGLGVLDDSLSGKVALVTGGARGIGEAACRALAAKGAVVAVHYRASADLAEQTAERICLAGGDAQPFGADLSEPEAITDLVASVTNRWGKVDILVNNAAEMHTARVVDLSDADWDRILSVNLSAAFRCARAVLPGMLERGWGRIISVTSQAAYNGSVSHAHYATAKAGLAGFTYSLAKEVATAGITVNMVAPGRILTDMIAEEASRREAEWLAQIPMRRYGQPEEVAGAIAFLASEAARYISGATIHVNGGQLMS